VLSREEAGSVGRACSIFGRREVAVVVKGLVFLEKCDVKALSGP